MGPTAKDGTGESGRAISHSGPSRDGPLRACGWTAGLSIDTVWRLHRQRSRQSRARVAGSVQSECKRTLSTNSYSRVKQTLVTNGLRMGCSCGLTDHGGRREAAGQTGSGCAVSTRPLSTRLLVCGRPSGLALHGRAVAASREGSECCCDAAVPDPIEAPYEHARTGLACIPRISLSSPVSQSPSPLPLTAPHTPPATYPYHQPQPASVSLLFSPPQYSAPPCLLAPPCPSTRSLQTNITSLAFGRPLHSVTPPTPVFRTSFACLPSPGRSRRPDYRKE